LEQEHLTIIKNESTNTMDIIKPMSEKMAPATRPLQAQIARKMKNRSAAGFSCAILFKRRIK
jgi:hypothetical protein